MTDIELLRKKISEIQKYYNILENYQGISKEDLLNDLTLMGAVERYLYLYCQSSIDFGEALISFLNVRRPATYGEVFEILFEKKIISQDVSSKMRKMVGFRNILSHAYSEVNVDLVLIVLNQDIKDVSQFIIEVGAKITGL